MTHPTQCVVITGASAGLGVGFAHRFAARGSDVVLVARRKDRLDALAAELTAAHGITATVLPMDLLEPDAGARLASALDERGLAVDALVNNASAFHPTPLDTVTPSQWDALFAVNARAPFFLAQAAAPHLRAAHGAIVNLADVYAHRPLATHAPYSASKAALVSLTRALALELAPQVRVNAVAPGAILWPEHGQPAQAQQAILAATALGRAGAPDDIAAAVSWLLSADAGYVTGQVLHVDGGRER